MSDARATLAEQADGSPALFRFAYRAVPFRVVGGETSARQRAGGQGVLLRAHVGTMPFTADGPALRRRMLAVLHRAGRMPGVKVRVASDNGICLTVSLPVDGAAQPSSVLEAAIKRLVEAKPLVDVVLSLLPTHLRNRTEHP